MQRIAQAARTMLTDRLLPFWQALRDEERGGYYGYMDFGLQLDKQAEKGCILSSRILWFFSEAAMVLADESLVPYARHAYRFLTEKCLDREEGGVYWSVTCDGQPLDTTKHTYNQAFAIYALSAYYRLTGEAEALNLARELLPSSRAAVPMPAAIWRRLPGTSGPPATRSSRRTALWRSGP